MHYLLHILEVTSPMLLIYQHPLHQCKPVNYSDHANINKQKCNNISYHLSSITKYCITKTPLLQQICRLQTLNLSNDTLNSTCEQIQISFQGTPKNKKLCSAQTFANSMKAFSQATAFPLSSIALLTGYVTINAEA